MFNRKEKSDTNNSSSRVVHAIFSSGVTVTGDVKSQDDLRIDGNIEGNVICEGKLIIGANGCITGNVECNSVELFGQIQGDVKASQLFTLRSESCFRGEANVMNMEIEPGAKFFGTCKMADEQKVLSEDIY
ncbi:MAG: polymer-forming cytoskeletal protein [Dysgonomonas sp.]|nr:polymer-forming cytoskeletal protein [Dysgonomonas sp.]